jgi:hypothetical protein
MAQVFDETKVAQQYQQYRVRRAIELETEAQLKAERVKQQETAKKAAERHRKACQPHIVTTRKIYKCAGCETEIPAGSRVIAQLSTAFFQYRGPTYLITIHYCPKCRIPVET